MLASNHHDIVVQATHMLYSIGILATIIQVISILLGLGLFVGALMQLRKFAESRTMMSHHITLWGPLSMMLAAILLLLLPYTVTTSLRAFFGDGQTTPLAYQPAASLGIDVYIPVVLAFVRLIGVGAIVRACLLFSKAGSQSSNGQLGKGLIYLFGGILCVHVLGTIHLIKSIFDV